MPRPANTNARDRLRSVGGHLIHTTSFGATGVQDITSAAGVPKGSFYSYFNSKEAFALELLDTYWQDIEDTYGRILRDTSFAPLDAVKQFFSGLITYHKERHYVPGCLVGNLALELATTNPAARDKLRQIYAHWTGGLVARLREAQQAGTLPSKARPSDIGAALVDAFEGAVMRAKVDQGPGALRRFEKFTLPAILR
jgi:TetR/AcrR family transcriptional repressor of nem operon